MACPRCGGKMQGGICTECGFPVTRIWKIAGLSRRCGFMKKMNSLHKPGN